MLLCVLIKALKAFDKVLLLVVGQSLDDIDHEDPIAAITESRTE